jgi:hypothetical protein
MGIEDGVLHKYLPAFIAHLADVEGEIAGFHKVGAILAMEVPGEVAEQQAVRRGFFDELEAAGLAGLEDAHGGEVEDEFEIPDQGCPAN